MPPISLLKYDRQGGRSILRWPWESQTPIDTRRFGLSVVAVAGEVWLYVFVAVVGPDDSDRALAGLLRTIMRRRTVCEWHRLDAKAGMFLGIRLQGLSSNWGHFYGDSRDLYETANELLSGDAVEFMDRELFNRFVGRSPESFGQRGIEPPDKHTVRRYRSAVW